MPIDFSSQQSGLESPARDVVPITPSDATDIPVRPRALWVNVAGNISIDTDSQSSQVLAVAAGVVPISPKRVRSTGTTATGIFGLY